MRITRLQLVLIVTVIVLWLGGQLFTTFATTERIDSCLGDCIQVDEYTVGKYAVELRTVAQVAGDNGPAVIYVVVDGLGRAQINGSFDYDLWSDVPVGHTSRAWIDDDWQLDLLIEVESGRYVIRSGNGRVEPMGE